jgi:hypothetical protein
MTCYNNAGALTGVTTIFQNKCYHSAQGAGCREHTGILAGAHRAADFNVYWGAAGKIDSVMDVTHNVAVPGPADPGSWNTHVGGSWGILNQAATNVGASGDGSTILTDRDFACVEPLRSYAAGVFTCAAGTPAYALSDVAVPGPIGFFSGGAAAGRAHRSGRQQRLHPIYRWRHLHDRAEWRHCTRQRHGLGPATVRGRHHWW